MVTQGEYVAHFKFVSSSLLVRLSYLSLLLFGTHPSLTCALHLQSLTPGLAQINPGCY